MHRYAHRFVVVALLAAAVVLPGAEPAQAAGSTMSCRASAIRITGEGPLAFLGTVEPVVANRRYDPCRDDEASVVDLTLPGGLGSARVLTAETETDMHESTSHAEVADLVLTVPGLPTIEAELLQASCRVSCMDEQGNQVPAEQRLSSDSEVVNLRIGGSTIDVPPGHTHIPLGIGTLHLNHVEKVKTPGRVGRPNHIIVRALWLDVPGLVDVVVGEARCGYEVR